MLANVLQRKHRSTARCPLAVICLTAVLCSWLLAASLICRHCNRIGNFLDLWFQLRLLEGFREQQRRQQGLASSNANLSRLDLAISGLSAHVRGVGLGVWLGRALRFRPTALPFTLHAVATAAVSLPPTEFWLLADGRNLLRQMTDRPPQSFFFWRSPEQVRQLAPFLVPTLRRLVRGYVSAARSSLHNATRHAPGTCIVHYRAGDFLRAGGTADRASAAALVDAAASFSSRPTRFVILDGGVTSHRCRAAPQPIPHTVSERAHRLLNALPTRAGPNVAGPPAASHAAAAPDLAADCGRPFAEFLALGLRRAFPGAAVVREEAGGGAHTADADFVRMASAPMLLVGGGSFALFAALANAHEVRWPTCVLVYDEVTCMPSLGKLAPGLRPYRHPRCGRCSAKMFNRS